MARQPSVAIYFTLNIDVYSVNSHLICWCGNKYPILYISQNKDSVCSTLQTLLIK